MQPTRQLPLDFRERHLIVLIQTRRTGFSNEFVKIVGLSSGAVAELGST